MGRKLQMPSMREYCGIFLAKRVWGSTFLGNEPKYGVAR